LEKHQGGKLHSGFNLHKQVLYGFFFAACWLGNLNKNRKYFEPGNKLQIHFVK